MNKKSLLMICAVVFLQACQTSGGASTVPSRAKLTADAREQAAIQSAMQSIRATVKSDYHVGGTDLVEIRVFQHEELFRELRITQEGTVSMPLIGAVKIGGLSVRDAENLIAEKLEEFLIKPQVTVFIKQYASKKIFVMGEVEVPGSFDLPTESMMTVLEAVSMAGGFTPIAAPDRTQVMRSVDGKDQTIPIVVSDIIKRGEKHKDIPLAPNDIVYVPQSFF